MFQIEYDLENGGVRAIRNADDESKMNWIEGTAVFGTVKNAEILSVNKTENGITAEYKTDCFHITVERKLIGEKYTEMYVFENTRETDVFIGRGGIGINTPFNDSYENASICMTNRCHTHIWCGESSSYIKAVKMGDFPAGLALVLTQGKLDSYSVERDLSRMSNDRGDFILHPSPFHLLAKQKMILEWEMVWFKEDEFEDAIAEYESVILTDAENYTVFKGEPIRFSVNRPNASVTLSGNPVRSETAGNKTFVEFWPAETGEYVFTVQSGKTETKAEFCVTLPFVELIRKRAEFIVNNQQFHCEGSPLDGAYLIYDNEEKRVHFEELCIDRNASRERLMMGLFIAKYLQVFPDERIYGSLMKYYRFVSREFYDEDTGEVYNTIRKNPKYKRLYNAPWMSVFVMEMYKLTKDDSYLDKMYKLLKVYYSIGGENFYPNGLSVYESVDALYTAGKKEMADDLLAIYQRHVDNIVKTGVYYPKHEVNYEQTIVSPAVTLVAQMYLLTKNENLIPHCREHLRILEKFNGSQPSFHLHEMAIRHWDGYFFGKRKNFGDTFPHPASIHTANAYLHYAMISGDEAYRNKAYKCARNLLSLFRSDGSASNTYVYPYSVNGVKCKYYDEFANDQDGVLYYLIKFYRFQEDGKE